MTIQRSMTFERQAALGDAQGQDGIPSDPAVSPEREEGIFLARQVDLGCAECRELGYCRREPGRADGQPGFLPCC